MSRCFPFPPPSYGAHGDTLIELIKLREEMEKAEKQRKEKRERKEKKREKKEKKREKKEKKQKRKEEKERKHKEGTMISHGADDGKKFKLIDEIKDSKADGRLQKGEDCENEQLERSGITEELDQPVTSVEPCCLSDSTQSSKRKRSSQQTTHDPGSAIKIRLPLRKHRQPEESKSESKFQDVSSGTVGGNTESFNKITFGSVTQSQGVLNTDPQQIHANSDSIHCKVLQNSVVGDAVVSKTTLVKDCQLQSRKSTESKQVLGNSDSRHGKAMQNSVQGNATVTKTALGSDRQLKFLTDTEPKQVLGNSDFRHGKGIKNVVRGEAVVSKNTPGSDCQLKCLTNTEPKRVLGNSDFRHRKAMQKSTRGDALITKTSPGSDSKLECPKNAEPKRVLGNTGFRHIKELENSVHGDAMVTDNAGDVVIDINNSVDDGIHEVESLYKSMLQIPPLTYDDLDSLDQDWLFSSEPTEARPVSKKQKYDSDVFQHSTFMWPRAQYLPEVEVYALPYAVPF